MLRTNGVPGSRACDRGEGEGGGGRGWRGWEVDAGSNDAWNGWTEPTIASLNSKTTDGYRGGRRGRAREGAHVRCSLWSADEVLRNGELKLKYGW